MNTIEVMEWAVRCVSAHLDYCRQDPEDASFYDPQGCLTNLRAAIERERERDKVWKQMREALTWLKALTFVGEKDGDTMVWPSEDTRRLINDALSAAGRIEKGENNENRG